MNIGFIGSGKMAEAIIAALIDRGAVEAPAILASDVSAERRAHMERRYGIRATGCNTEVVGPARVVFLAVKPQQLDDVLRELAPHVSAEHLVISIAAGRRTAHVESRLPRGRVIRVMPNIACLVGAGMSVLTRGSRAGAGDAEVVRNLLRSCGEVVELPEECFDAVTALSGSGPAFFAYLLDRLVDGAVAEGLPRADALILAEQTMLGTARLLIEHKMAPAELADAVTSAKGTTAEGRKILETATVAEILRQTIRAAAGRSRELSQT